MAAAKRPRAPGGILHSNPRCAPTVRCSVITGLLAILVGAPGLAAPPAFKSQSHVTSLREDAGVDSAVLLVEATDPDGDQVTYSIVGGNAGTVFDISSHTGAITLQGQLDFETIQKYYLTIQASAGSDTTSTVVTVEVVNVDEGTRDWKSHFGVALTVTQDLGTDRVSQATIVDENGIGIVRVEKTEDSPARIMLEVHHFFPNRQPVAECAGMKRRERSDACVRARELAPAKSWAWGPFVAVQPGTEDIIEAVGGGVLFGWQTPGSQNTSFNLGVGYVIDPSVRILGNGFIPGEPAPLDGQGRPQPIRYLEVDQGGLLFVLSFAWR